MLSDFAAKLWSFLVGLFHGTIQWFGDTFGKLFNFLGNLFSDLYDFLTGLLQDFLDALVTVLKKLFQPIFDLIEAIFHFVEKLFEFLWLLLQLFLQLGHLIIAFIEGLFDTLAGLNYDGSTPSLDSQMSGSVDVMNTAMSILQLDNASYICLFAVWIFTAVAVVKMIGKFRGNG
jgi:phage-related protein